VSVPINTTATIYIPNRNGLAITENGQLAQNASEIKMVGEENNCSVFQVEGGEYRFMALYERN